MSDSSFAHLVVIGSSAGGVEALSRLVSTLPEDFSAPIVIAQHLDPHRVSHLGDILSRRSTLPVRTITEHEPLEAGVVFVVPANRHVNITASEVDLRVDSARQPKPSIDLLLSSAAESFGERLIAAILTGTGSDGTEGARVVREAGGTVVIQDPDTAEFGEMPRSLAPNTVDIVAGLDSIAEILKDLVSGTEVLEERSQRDEEEPLDHFLEELRERHGIDFRSYKTPTIMRRLKRRMVATGSESIEAYTRYLNDHPQEYRHLIKTFLIKVTEFFRDPELFDFLKEEILPELVDKARKEGNQLRLWSAGCATGEEAYSLAILVSEILGSEAALFNARIFATDVDDDAVNFARHGIYPASALQNLPEEQKSRYFIKDGNQYQIKKHVRGMIVFGEHDLARRSPFPRIDLVVSRNVLIYFTTELQRRALQLFACSLRDGGYLVLGKAEAITPLSEFFEPQHHHHKVYRRQGERFLMPPTLPVSPAPAPKRSMPHHSRRTVSLQASSEPQRESQLVRTTDESLLNQLPVGVIVVDRRYHIQAINTAARQLLFIRGAAIGEDLLHLMQEVPYTEVREAIDAAFRDGEFAGTGEFVVEEVATGDICYLQLVCQPERTEGEWRPAERVMIVVNDVTELARARRELEKQVEGTKAEFERFRHEAEAEAAHQETQNARLIETNRRLEEANRELTEFNQELQSSYEESLVSTEEAQAATEEVETLNEELQATNEELETLNEELQATIEELNTTNDDLQARTQELQELAQTREEERQTSETSRQRLETILQSMSDAVLAVNAEGKMLFSDETFKELFGEVSGADTGYLGGFALLDENGERLPPEATPQARAARGESFVMRFVAEEDGGARRLFEAKGKRIGGENEVGGVIVFREVTEGSG